MIAIGNQFGGPEQRGAKIHVILNRAMNIAADTRASDYDNGKEAWINPIFMVPGSIYQPDFEGYKLGHFSRKKKGLVVMISVPQAVADGQDVDVFVGVSLREAARRAAAHFAKRGINFSSSKAEDLIRAIERGLKEIAAN